MSYMSAFEYQSKSSVSISDLNKLRKYIKLGKNNIEEIKAVFEEIIHIFRERKIKDVNILISFNLRNIEDSEKSTIYQLYRTIQNIFENDSETLNKFINILDELLKNGRENIDNMNKDFLISNIAKIMIAIDDDVIEFKNNEDSNSLFTSKGF